MKDEPATHARFIFLTGMMGAGKTTAGPLLAKALGWRFLDLDRVLEDTLGQTIESFFLEFSEALFREKELLALTTLLEREQHQHPSSQGLVLALGGGTWIQDSVPDLLGPLGPTLFLDVSVDELVTRLNTDTTRPLLHSAEQGLAHRLRSMHAQRIARYRQADVSVPLDGASPHQAALRMMHGLAQHTGHALPIHHVSVPLAERSYPIDVSPGGAHAAGTLLAAHIDGMLPLVDAAFVITDERVASHHLEAFLHALRDAMPSLRIASAVIPEGERSKSVAQWHTLTREALDAHLTRRSLVVAFGGGVVGDLAGFVAATLLRGVRYVQIPTTILSQVDSSVGGKTGVNSADHGKNLIGAFYQPVAVIAPMGTLETLASRQVSSGLAEVVKYALLDSDSFLSELEESAHALATAPHRSCAKLIARCCAQKAAIVEADERESGRGQRILLNLGHTFGHAFEAMGSYRGLLHGEAVALGILVSVRASECLGLMPSAQADALVQRLTALLERLALPTDPSEFFNDPDTVVSWMKRDKKVHGSSITLILPRRPGEIVRHTVATSDLSTLVVDLSKFWSKHSSVP